MKKSLFHENLKAVLCDVDGTLVDSNDAHAAAWQRALGHFGYELDYLEVRKKIGMGADHLLLALTGVIEDSDLGKQMTSFRGDLFAAEYLPKLKAFPGARNLLLRLHEKRLRLVVATSGSEEDLKSILKQTKLEGIFDEVVTSSDAKKSKPSTDILRAALQKADVKANEAFMIGDTPYDIEASLGLGLPIVAVTCGGWPKEALAQANVVFESPSDFLQYTKM